ncbi:MAG: 2Fe-2S iron-sulfur cluster binding domain-containing protein [Spirochaetales bacterium]|nr:2Fe-2S iron-sulfur cluster binding domain-containing protein [Candidatus Physcosoma equi]
MTLSLLLNGRRITRDVEVDMTLYAFLRQEGCFSVKCGCTTSSCGLCTVLLDGRPILSCSLLALRADGASVTTLEGVQKEAEELGRFISHEGAEQCGFCNPGYMMNAIALLRENPNPTEEEVKLYLAGNLCRCSGYEGQLRGIMNYVAWKNGGQK